MKTLFTAEAISKGGRSGTIETPDGLLNVTLGNPLERGAEKRMDEAHKTCPYSKALRGDTSVKLTVD
jgi:organic hydroperoxide reductase OsmC/OhrA